MRRYRLALLLGLALTGLTLLAYAPLGRNDFVSLDDPLYVSDNPMVQKGLTAEGVLWAWTTFHASNWHPLTWMSLQLDAQLFGPHPVVVHRVNLLFHLANVLLLFVILRRMTGAVWRSALVAALFAVHPLHVESVAWAAERKDVLSVFFGLLALLAYVRHAARPGLFCYSLVVITFTLSLLAKPTLVTLPLTLLLLDCWPLRRLRFRRSSPPVWQGVADGPRFEPASPGWLLVEKVPLVALSLLSCQMTIASQAAAVLPLEALPLSLRLENAVVAVAGYLVKTLWPQGLAVFYPHPMGRLPVWQVAGATLVLTALTALALQQARRRPYLLVGWLWFLGTLVPVIGVVQVGDQAMADRYTYVPHIGLFVMAVWGLADLLAVWRCPAAVRGGRASRNGSATESRDGRVSPQSGAGPARTGTDWRRGGGIRRGASPGPGLAAPRGSRRLVAGDQSRREAPRRPGGGAAGAAGVSGDRRSGPGPARRAGRGPGRGGRFREGERHRTAGPRPGAVGWPGGPRPADRGPPAEVRGRAALP